MASVKSKRKGLVDTVIGHAVDHYLDRPGVYFWPSTIVNKTTATPDIRDWLADQKSGTGRRMGVSSIVMRYIKCRVRSEIGRKDEFGVRIFESYQGAEKERRFMVFDSFTYEQVKSARDHCKAGAKDMIRKTDVYDLLLKLMEEHGIKDTTVGDVRDELNEMVSRMKKKRA